MAATRSPSRPRTEQVIGYRPHPKQWEALCYLGLGDRVPPAVPVEVDDQGTPKPQWVEEFLFGGQAAGGKSYLARALAVALCVHWPGVRIPIFRRTYPELEDSHIPWIQEEVQAPVAVYHVQRHELRFANGSVLMFRHAEQEQSVYAYNTAQWGALIIDQADAFTEFQIRFLRSRVRQPVGAFNGTWRPLILYSANPGGPAHQYFRDGFVDAAPAGTVFTAPASDGGMRRCYLPARLADNPSIDPEDYRKRLQGLPEHLVRAYMEGDWSGVLGAYFQQWRACDLDGNPWHVWPESFAKKHYGLPAAAPFPPQEWLHWAAVDGGVRDPWCLLGAVRAPDRRVILYHEEYGTGVEVPEQARRIKALVGKGHPWRRILADPAMFATRANLSVSDAQVYAGLGIGLTRGNNHRQQGWRRVSELLSTTLEDGYPQLVVLEGRCPQLVKTLPLLLVDPLDREDVSDEHGKADPASVSAIRDDAPDACRYLVTPVAAPPAIRRYSPLAPEDEGAGGPVSLGGAGRESHF